MIKFDYKFVQICNCYFLDDISANLLFLTLKQLQTEKSVFDEYIRTTLLQEKIAKFHGKVFF